MISYIEDNLESELSLAEIAKVAGVSVSHLKTLFRQSTGMPVHQYVLRRRVERAKLLLQDDSLSIAQVAFAAGFAHQSHLARHMRSCSACTPAVARKDAGQAVPGSALSGTSGNSLTSGRLLFADRSSRLISCA